jgi:hypothetical protein
MEKHQLPNTDEIVTQAAAREIRGILIKNGLFNNAPYLVQRWLTNNDGVDHSRGESNG